jgi:hypothetical protein
VAAAIRVLLAVQDDIVPQSREKGSVLFGRKARVKELVAKQVPADFLGFAWAAREEQDS